MQIIKQFFNFGALAILSRLVSFITFPVLAANFTVSEYGELDFLGSLISFVAIVSCFGTDSAVGKLLSKANNDIEISKIAWSGIIANSSLLLIVSIFVFGYLKNASNFNFDIILVFGFVISIISQVIFNYSLNLLKWTKEYAAYRQLTVFNILAQTLLIIVFLNIYKMTTGEYLALMGLSMFFAVLTKIKIIKKKLRYNNSLTFYLNELIVIGIPFGLISMIGVLLPVLERHILQERFGMDMLGIYAVGTKFGSILLVLATAFQVAWGPEVLTNIEKNTNKKFYTEYSNFILHVFLCGLVAIHLIIPYLLDFFQLQKFNDVVYLYIPIATCIMLHNLSKVVDIGIAYSGKFYISMVPYSPLVFIYLLLILDKNLELEIKDVFYIILTGHLLKYLMTYFAALRLSGIKFGAMLPFVYSISLIALFEWIFSRKLNGGAVDIYISILSLIISTVFIIIYIRKIKNLT